MYQAKPIKQLHANMANYVQQNLKHLKKRYAGILKFVSSTVSLNNQYLNGWFLYVLLE